MIFTLKEIMDIAIMTLAVGYIFTGFFKKHMDKSTFLFACTATAPALIAHELAHKFAALSFGLEAEFHAAYVWLAIGMALRLLGSNFVFFVPAYVSIGGTQVTPMASAIIAAAGPLLNLTLFAATWALLKRKRMKHKTFAILQVTKQINLFLFIFNMLPIPFFDGMKVYTGMYQAITQ